MSDETQAVDIEQSEREALEARATQLGVKFHPSLSTEKLQERVDETLASEDVKTAYKEELPEPETKEGSLRNEALSLVRVRVTCMNPNKKEWEGEIFCTGNAKLGTIKKMVPFEVEWHVPRIILNMIKRRQYQTFVTKKTPNGGKIKTGKLVREFAVEELEPLSEKELAELRQRQIMREGNQE